MPAIPEQDTALPYTELYITVTSICHPHWVR